MMVLWAFIWWSQTSSYCQAPGQQTSRGTGAGVRSGAVPAIS